MVTSTGSGLSVPDWPNTYGHFMFSYPLSKMVGGVLYEHGHRMVASVVGMLTVILAIWIWIKEKRTWLKWFAGAALAAVIIQGILGGLTVLFLLPTAISVAHGTLAQAFFCMTICIAMFTSKGWQEPRNTITDNNVPDITVLTKVTTGFVFVQLILGATMRHMGAGLAIPDFPLAFGQIVPPFNSASIIVHFIHRLGAVFVSIAILFTAFRILRNHNGHPKLTQPAIVLVFALILQITLAALTIWTKKAMLPTSMHVITGAFILGTSLFLAIRAHMSVQRSTSEIHNRIVKPISAT
jgi:cytochrome c oxidase assembly protein subunit 15